MENYSLDEKLACRKSKIKKSNKVKNILPKSKNYPNPACTDGMKLNEKKKSISPRNLYFKNSPRIHFKYLIMEKEKEEKPQEKEKEEKPQEKNQNQI